MILKTSVRKEGQLEDDITGQTAHARGKLVEKVDLNK